MLKLKLKRTTVSLYDSIQELPITKFMAAQDCILVESAVGSTIADFDKRLAEMTIPIQAGDKVKAMACVENMRALFWNITQKQTATGYGFINLVKKKVIARMMNFLRSYRKKG